MIDWEHIKERGAQGLLTADETDALVEIASSVTVDDWCDYCGAMGDNDSRMPIPHKWDCPIVILENAGK